MATPPKKPQTKHICSQARCRESPHPELMPRGECHQALGALCPQQTVTAPGKVPVTRCPFILVPLPSGEGSAAAHCHMLLLLPLIGLLAFPFLSPHFFFGSDPNLRCCKTLQEALGRQPTLTPSLLSYKMWLFAIFSPSLASAEFFWRKLFALILTSHFPFCSSCPSLILDTLWPPRRPLPPPHPVPIRGSCPSIPGCLSVPGICLSASNCLSPSPRSTSPSSLGFRLPSLLLLFPRTSL